MFRFGEPQYLYLLIVLPLLAVFYFYSNYRRRKKLREYGSPELLAHLMPDVSKYRPDVKFWLTLSALAMVLRWPWLFSCWLVRSSVQRWKR